MFKSAVRFVAALVSTFVLLTYMWVSAAQADTGCRALGDGITLCDGAGFQLPEAPRGTVRRLPKVRVGATVRVVGSSAIGARLGHTVVIARLGTRS